VSDGEKFFLSRYRERLWSIIMAAETVVKEMLTQEMIQAGAEITRRLDEAHLEVRASLWWYIPDKNLWRLIVASPAVRRDGLDAELVAQRPLLELFSIQWEIA